MECGVRVVASFLWSVLPHSFTRFLSQRVFPRRVILDANGKDASASDEDRDARVLVHEERL